jgi:hypothetical protein
MNLPRKLTTVQVLERLLNRLMEQAERRGKAGVHLTVSVGFEGPVAYELVNMLSVCAFSQTANHRLSLQQDTFPF